MTFGGPWNLRGLLPEVREAARAAARRSGMSVGEWLNSVIEVVDEEDGELTPSTGFDRCSDDCSRQSVRSDDRWHRDAGWRDRGSNGQRRQNFRAEEREQNRPYRDADWRDREANAQRRQSFRAEEREQDRPYRDDDWRGRACMEETEVPVRRQGGPYREDRRGEAGNGSRRKPGR